MFWWLMYVNQIMQLVINNQFLWVCVFCMWWWRGAHERLCWIGKISFSQSFVLSIFNFGIDWAYSGMLRNLKKKSEFLFRFKFMYIFLITHRYNHTGIYLISKKKLLLWYQRVNVIIWTFWITKQKWIIIWISQQ